MKPEKLNDAGRERLRAVAMLKVRIPRAKTLAVELNITPNYVRQMLCRFMQEIVSNEHSLTVVVVPRESQSEHPAEGLE